jgi:hypothetical protein
MHRRSITHAIALIAAAIALIGANPARATTVTLPVIEDVTVDSGEPASSLGSDPELIVGWEETPAERSHRTLVRFDLGALPSGAMIESAWLELDRTAPGEDGLVARVDGAWNEDGTTWSSQPGYAPPLIDPEGADPARWDVTPIVIAWQMGLIPEHGFAVLETFGEARRATYESRESGPGARLIVTYEVDTPDNPQPPPGLGPPTFSLDPGLVPFEPQLPDIWSGGTSYARPLAVLQVEGGAPYVFVADEVILAPASAAELELFVAATGGTILRTPGLPATPPELLDQERSIPPETEYLIKIDPATVDTSSIDTDAAAIGLLGELRVSSDDGLRGIAVVLQETLSGLDVSLNFAGQLAQHFPPLALEEHPSGASFEDPLGDAFMYPEMDDAANNFTGVNRAWQYLAFARRATSIDVAVMDAGFCLQPGGARCNDGAGGTHIDLPPTFQQYDFNDDDYDASGDNLASCAGGSSCPDHGSGTVSIATAIQDNQYDHAQGDNRPLPGPACHPHRNEMGS